MKSSAVPNFFELSIKERLMVLRDFLGLSEKEMSVLSDLSTLGPKELEAIGENPVSSYELPLRVANFFKINDADYFVPMVVEEASVIAGVCYGAKLCYESGGIRSRAVKQSKYATAAGQIQLLNVKDPPKTRRQILGMKRYLLEKANQGHEFSRAYDIRTRWFRSQMGKTVIVDIYVDSGDAMGAAVASDMAESVAKEILRATRCAYNACIISNYSGRRVKAEARVSIESLARKSPKKKEWSGEDVRDRVVWLSMWAERDFHRAVTHNKGIMNGVDAVGVATGQDWRAIESANHAFACRNGRYMPLSRWRAEGDYLMGELEMLIPCGIVGGEIRNFPKAEFVLKKVLRVKVLTSLQRSWLLLDLRRIWQP